MQRTGRPTPGLNSALVTNVWVGYVVATALLLLYTWFIAQVERKELVKLPFVGKYFQPKM